LKNCFTFAIWKIALHPQFAKLLYIRNLKNCFTSAIWKIALHRNLKNCFTFAIWKIALHSQFEKLLYIAIWKIALHSQFAKLLYIRNLQNYFTSAIWKIALHPQFEKLLYIRNLKNCNLKNCFTSQFEKLLYIAIWKIALHRNLQNCFTFAIWKIALLFAKMVWWFWNIACTLTQNLLSWFCFRCRPNKMGIQIKTDHYQFVPKSRQTDEFVLSKNPIELSQCPVHFKTEFWKKTWFFYSCISFNITVIAWKYIWGATRTGRWKWLRSKVKNTLQVLTLLLSAFWSHFYTFFCVQDKSCGMGKKPGLFPRMRRFPLPESRVSSRPIFLSCSKYIFISLRTWSF